MAKPAGRGSVVDQLRQKIRASEQSLNQLSRASGVSVAQLSRFLRGQRMLTLPVAEKVARALGLALALSPVAGRARGKRGRGEG
jgi:transcriptional regulator with XRE-family HTH domain